MKYTVDSLRPKLEEFLTPLLNHAGFELTYELHASENPHPEVENPEVTVKFSGPDVDLLLSNRGELLLALGASFDGGHAGAGGRSFADFIRRQ